MNWIAKIRRRRQHSSKVRRVSLLLRVLRFNPQILRVHTFSPKHTFCDAYHSFFYLRRPPPEDLRAPGDLGRDPASEPLPLVFIDSAESLLKEEALFGPSPNGLHLSARRLGAQMEMEDFTNSLAHTINSSPRMRGSLFLITLSSQSLLFVTIDLHISGTFLK